MGFAKKELEQTRHDVVNGGATRDVRGLRNLRRDNFRCPTCVRGVVAMPQRVEVG